MPRRSTTRCPSKPTDQSSSTADSRETSHAAFQARIKTGDFEAVLGRGLRRTLRAAAADPSLDLEIGALRLALARLLQAEDDTKTFAATVAQVARVALQAVAHRPGPDSVCEEMRAALLQSFAEYEAELAEEQNRQQQAHAADGSPAWPTIELGSPHLPE